MTKSVFAGTGRTRRGDQANEPTTRGEPQPGVEDGGVTSGPTVELTGGGGQAPPPPPQPESE